MNIDAIKEHMQAIEKLLSEEEEISEFVLGRHIPGFRPLHDGEEWSHAGFWTEKHLPSGWRPLIAGERIQAGDEWWVGTGWEIIDGTYSCVGAAHEEKRHCENRTRRPLPEPAPEPAKEKFYAVYEDLQPDAEPAKVQLGPGDVPPGSVFRLKSPEPYTFLTMSNSVVYFADSVLFSRTWEWLKDNATIHRPGNLDANGKPVFQPCYKLQ